MRFPIILILTLGFSLSGKAQSDSIIKPRLVVHADSIFLELEKRYAESNQKSDGGPGFRIQIYNGPRRDADQRRMAFIREFPEMKAYLSYDAPEYRVQVGDFRDRIHAHAMVLKIKNVFPSAFVVEGFIESPSWEESHGNQK
ncbi:MAG: SPOR domain-containing protein [Cryomorphaceae bacterium]|nr:SPOR domain-containing protein [Cryomorphaceae bacterium]